MMPDGAQDFVETFEGLTAMAISINASSITKLSA